MISHVSLCVESVTVYIRLMCVFVKQELIYLQLEVAVSSCESILQLYEQVYLYHYLGRSCMQELS